MLWQIPVHEVQQYILGNRAHPRYVLSTFLSNLHLDSKTWQCRGNKGLRVPIPVTNECLNERTFVQELDKNDGNTIDTVYISL
jgi:hypothetical protein